MVENRGQNSKGRFKLWEISVFVFVLVILALIIFPALVKPVEMDKETASIARAHNLDISAFGYSQDHNGVYPFGGSSTEIFQKLYDGKYLEQPADVFLTDNGGKSIASVTSNRPIKLKPENVSWDFVTHYSSGLTGSDPSDLPIIFSDVDTVPNWRSGVNNAIITSSNPWGTDGVTVVTLSQQTLFVRPVSMPGQVQLTTGSFNTTMIVTYVTQKP